MLVSPMVSFKKQKDFFLKKTMLGRQIILRTWNRQYQMIQRNTVAKFVQYIRYHIKEVCILHTYLPV